MYFTTPIHIFTFLTVDFFFALVIILLLYILYHYLTRYCLCLYVVPEEFMYNPVSRSYGEPHKRPEVQNATIEFIAPSEYMVGFNVLLTLIPLRKKVWEGIVF